MCPGQRDPYWKTKVHLTPWKINMEPTNHPFRKENDLPNLHCPWSCSMLIFRGVRNKNWTNKHHQLRPGSWMVVSMPCLLKKFDNPNTQCKYGRFIYIWVVWGVNVGLYTIHWVSGNEFHRILSLYVSLCMNFCCLPSPASVQHE